MEGDAKGQVGGLDMSKGERERLAVESRGWRCKGCGGRTNDQVLLEEGGGEKDGDGAGEGVQKVVLPEELRFGFKDQMGAAAGAGEEEKKKKMDKGKQKEETVPPVSTVGTQGERQVTISQPKVVKEVEQVVSSPAGPAIALHARSATAQTPVRVTADGVPAWIDKAITGVVAALAFLILKKILV